MSFEIVKLASMPDGTYEGLDDERKWMPVPRCDTCARWAPQSGACTFIKIDAPSLRRGALLLLTTADFGCVRWKAF